MSYDFTFVDGERVEVHVAAALALLETAFRARWGLDLIVSSGVRTREEQERLYAAWQAYQAGGPQAALAAPPGQSNHEVDGPIGPRAVDLRDSGADAGVASLGSARDAWMVASAPTYGFNPAGHDFDPREAWHYEYTGSLDGPAPAGISSTAFAPEEDIMRFIDGPNIIIWPNGVINSYPQDVYTAIKQYLANPTSDAWAWAHDTFVREAWAAFNVGAAAVAAATVAALPANTGTDDHVDVAQLAAAIAAAMPKSFTVTAQ